MIAANPLFRIRPSEPRPFWFSAEQFERMAEWGFFEHRAAELSDGVVIDTESHVPRPFTHDEFFQMVDDCWFEETRVELIGGEVIEMPAQKNDHLLAIDLMRDALVAAFGSGFWVRVQGTLNLSPFGVPDPDLAVVAIGYRSAGLSNPTSAFLVVESSYTTLRFDRGRKASMYAAAGIADYWIINLIDRQLEIRRHLQPDSSAPSGSSYATTIFLKPGDAATPLAAPTGSIAVTDVLP